MAKNWGWIRLRTSPEIVTVPVPPMKAWSPLDTKPARHTGLTFVVLGQTPEAVVTSCLSCRSKAIWWRGGRNSRSFRFCLCSYFFCDIPFLLVGFAENCQCFNHFWSGTGLFGILYELRVLKNIALHVGGRLYTSPTPLDRWHQWLFLWSVFMKTTKFTKTTLSSIYQLLMLEKDLQAKACEERLWA